VLLLIKQIYEVGMVSSWLLSLVTYFYAESKSNLIEFI